jgi:hypothetical protein
MIVKSRNVIQEGRHLFSKAIGKTLKEYCLAKISDWLGCGPTMPNFFGFDLLVFSDRVEFAI